MLSQERAADAGHQPIVAPLPSLIGWPARLLRVLAPLLRGIVRRLFREGYADHFLVQEAGKAENLSGPLRESPPLGVHSERSLDVTEDDSFVTACLT